MSCRNASRSDTLVLERMIPMKKMNALFLVLIMILTTAAAGCSETPKQEAVPTPAETAPVSEPEPSAETDQFTNTVWTGSKKDIMYSYKLEMLDSGKVYLLEYQGDEIRQVEEGTYEYSDGMLKFHEIPMIQKTQYDEGTNRIMLTMGDAQLLFTFRMSDEAVMSAAQLEELMNHTEVVIEGWPADVPTPDFGGEITTNNLNKGGITLIFHNVDPEKVKEYAEKLKAAGFTTRAEERDALQEERVDADGNPFYTHIFDAGKGKEEYSELVGWYIPEGYYIHFGYTDKDEYDKDSRKLASKPRARIDLTWKDIIFGKEK